MDLAGMTEVEKLDILYADASWLNDDGTEKENYIKEHGAITKFLEEHKRIFFDLLNTNNGTDICTSLKISYGTFQNWIARTRDKPGKIENKRDGKKRSRVRSKANKTEDNVITDNANKKVKKELTFIQRLEKEQIDIENGIKQIEQLVNKLPEMKKVLESIGCLITQLEELEKTIEEKSLDGVIDVALVKVVEEMPVFDGGSSTFKHTEQ